MAALAEFPHHKCVAKRDSADPNRVVAPLQYLTSGVWRYPITAAVCRDILNYDNFADYNPPDYTAAICMGRGPKGEGRPPWADSPVPSSATKWNELERDPVTGKAVVDRRSLGGKYLLRKNYTPSYIEEEEGPLGLRELVYLESYVTVPLNPCGLTGITGRGLLGRWGPNHAADPLVTRYKTKPDADEHLAEVEVPTSTAPGAPKKRLWCVLNNETKLPVLECVCIKRAGEAGRGEWALPGGMVDPGEVVSLTVRREFGEEALAGCSAEERRKIDELFQVSEDDVQRGCSEVLYKGYVDDPRNTDNAWMETVVFHFHDAGDTLQGVNFRAGSDAADVAWVAISSKLELYASHSEFVRLAAQQLGAHW